jgi:UDPglucose 6-dehydrogenase
MPNVRKELGDRITFHDDPVAAVDQAEALVLCTEWAQYRTPDFADIRARMRQPVVIDGRNQWSRDDLTKLGFIYEGIGRRGR